MKAFVQLIFVVIILASCSNENTKNENYEKLQKEVIHQEYPWNEDITEVAIEAIHRTIRNVQDSAKEGEEGFPSNPYNVPFSQKEIVEFLIIGYSHSSDRPDIFQIDFKPANEFGPGPRITVEVNAKSKKALRVFMQADS